MPVERCSITMLNSWEQLQPKMFLFDNVRGLLTHDKGRTYKTITDIFESTGYTIQKKVLNAWN